MTYSSLYTFGCSHTFGAEMGDSSHNPWVERLYEDGPSEFAWPAVLGKYLDLPVNNMGIPGASPDCISRTIVKEIDKIDNALIGILWPNYLRFENSIEIAPGWEVWINFQPNSHPKPYGKNLKTKWVIEYKKSATELDQYYSFFKNIHYVKLLLESKNLSYFMLNVSIGNTKGLKHFNKTDALDRFEPILNDSKFIFPNSNQTFDKWCTNRSNDNNYPRAPKGHYLEQCHEDYVNVLLGPKVKELYL